MAAPIVSAGTANADQALKPASNAAAPQQHVMTRSEWATVQTPAGCFPFLDPPHETGDLGAFGSYRILQRLGQGGMGVVFRAEDPRLQRHVALKIMLLEIAQDDVARQRFLREARATAAIRSDHIVAIYEIGQHKDLPFLVTELLQGQALDACLRGNGPQPLAKVLDFGRQIARGLEAAHRSGLIHRDIKPANIWVEEPAQHVKILDFGLARLTQTDPGLTQSGAILGTPAYMAPEQADGKVADERSDLFSLGCVLYEMAAGQKPFDGPSAIAVMKAIALNDPPPLHEIVPALVPELSDLVMRLIEKDPGKRPESASAVADALEAIASDTQPQVTARVSGTALPGSVMRSRVKKPHEPRRRLAVRAAMAALALLACVSGLWILAHGQPDTAISSEDGGQPKPAIAVQGVTDDEILLGMSAPFSGTARELGRELEMGIQTYLRHVNEEGGIGRRKLRLLALDDGYDPDRALANMKDLFEKHRVFATIGNVGTPTAEKTLPYALSKQMLFFGAFSGAALLRNDPPDRYVFNYRASYEDETAAIVKYLTEVKAFRPEQIAVFAQSDGYGDAGFKGVSKTLRKHERRLEDILRVGHQRNSVDVSAAVNEILRHEEIRVVVMVSTYRPAAAFIKQLKDAKRDLVFTNVSFVGSDALADELRQMGPGYAKDVIVTQVVPHPASHGSAVLKYRELLRKHYPSELPGFVSLEGYINAAILVEGLRRAGSNLSTESLVDALESIRGLDLGLGMQLHFGPSDHQGSNRVWGTVLDAAGQYQMLDLD